MAVPSPHPQAHPTGMCMWVTTGAAKLSATLNTASFASKAPKAANLLVAADRCEQQSYILYVAYQAWTTHEG